MKQIYSSAAHHFTGAITNQLIHSGPGKVFSIVAANTNASTPHSLGLYDTTTTGNTLIGICIGPGQTLAIHFPQNTPLVFAAGLVITVGADLEVNLITEA